ncbi:GNAT family N-acetyltransferase [Streptomyces sp. LX-29]|uniref:GNAT family N-acetyltransferase n=1 Tax=Streptomyces sp. LX-29 TaxID=2900152 RepID=UPI00240D5BA0|nr:GNAT family N-acetyltransferase [Streptomyces sp. LX-29]WFB11636.1 GNAT family N-acetyltransferase [Streptomyces sp. LX-29]
MPIAQPSIRLRVPLPDDATAWHRVFDHPDVMEFHGGSAQDLAHYEEFTERQRKLAAEHGFCLYTLLDETDQVLGFTGAQPWPQSWGPVGEIEIGWRLGRAFWGLGYATLAAEATLERVRAAGVDRVVAMVDARNERSLAVTRRLGMRRAETYVSPVSGATAVCHRLEL